MDSQPLHNLMTPYSLGKRYLYAAADGGAMFTDNETNFDQLKGTSGQNKSPFVKDAFHRQIVNGESCTNPQLQGMLKRMWDPNEFRSDYGLRSLSRFHEGKPYEFAGQVVRYEPGETEFSIKGGNSNWRGPIWFPTSFLMIESLRKLAKVYGEEVQVPSAVPGTPTNNVSDPLANPLETSTTLMGMANGYADSMISMFTRDINGRRPIFGKREVMQSDPHWRDCLLFHEYFHADTGEGLGACHQTGWTGLVACLIDEWRR